MEKSFISTNSIRTNVSVSKLADLGVEFIIYKGIINSINLYKKRDK